jgi:hypothetical protein
MNAIENYFFENFSLKNLNLNISEDAQRYSQNAKADAIHCYQNIKSLLIKKNYLIFSIYNLLINSQ